MVQQKALETISESLKRDPSVQAIFVKGSIGRGEEDEYSDIDLYCMVNEEDKERFLNRRLEHLQAYRKIIFQEDYFIIAPQIIAVFDNLLHVDLFTVTEETFISKDYFKVLYDPKRIMDKYKQSQNLLLTSKEFADHVYDVAWYLFQYRKAFKRGNHIWAIEMLHFVIVNLAKVLLHRYNPERAQLGIKSVATLLPKNKLKEFQQILNEKTPLSHQKAVARITELLKGEEAWIIAKLPVDSQAGDFIRLMLSELEGCLAEV